MIRSFVAAAAMTVVAGAAQPTNLVLQNGRSIPLDAVALQGDKLIIKGNVDGFLPNQALPMSSVDHVYGDKPEAINQGLAILLSDRERAKEVVKMLEPLVNEHRLTAKIPGNFWIEAAKVLMLAYALNSDASACTTLGKELSDATPAQGADPMVGLCKTMMMSPLTKAEERDAALKDHTTDNLPADICAFASYYRGELFAKEAQSEKALEAYLQVTCLYPSGNAILNAASEIKAADLLSAAKKSEEAMALATSAFRSSTGTILADEAKKRLESLK